MSVTSNAFLGTIVASSDDSRGSGGASLLMIVLVVIGVLVVASLFDPSNTTYVVVERPTGLLTTLFVLGGGLGLLYLLIHLPTNTF